jgi:hypothetical protein
MFFRKLIAIAALCALSACAAGQPYVGVEGGPSTASHLQAD